MGLKNNMANITYLRLRDGKFYVGKDKENGQPDLEGRITAMRFKDEEFEGAPVRKLIVTLNDGQDTFQLGLNTDSQNYSTFVSFLKNVDINDTVTLHAKSEAIEGKEFRKQTLLVSQDGTYAKSYFNKENKHGAPEWKQVKVGKKLVTDKSDYLDFMEKFVTENFINKLEKQEAPVKKEALIKQKEEPVGQEVEQLPWDN